jgi:hypothetical protein
MYRRKVDANQKSLVAQIRKCGISVAHLHTVGKGMGDILIGKAGQNFLLEIKDPAKTKSQKKLTPDEEKFHAAWQGQITVVETLDDVLKLFQ